MTVGRCVTLPYFGSNDVADRSRHVSQQSRKKGMP